MASDEIKVRLVLEDTRALRRLERLAETLADLADDFAYRDDVRQAVRDVRYVLKHLGVMEEG